MLTSTFFDQTLKTGNQGRTDKHKLLIFIAAETDFAHKITDEYSNIIY